MQVVWVDNSLTQQQNCFCKTGEWTQEQYAILLQTELFLDASTCSHLPPWHSLLHQYYLLFKKLFLFSHNHTFQFDLEYKKQYYKFFLYN